MTRLIALAGLVALSSASAAQAQTTSDALGTCLSDNTTGRDRKDLARWMFTAMAAHPDMAGLSTVTDAERTDAARVVGSLFTRLVVEACPDEVRVAVATGGPTAIGDGFETLGSVAMQELMRNERVATALGGIEAYMNAERIGDAIQGP